MAPAQKSFILQGILFHYMRVLLAATSSSEFIFTTQINGNTCTGGASVFTYTAFSMFHCASIWHRHMEQALVAVIYEGDQQQCFGCSSIRPSDLTTMPGTVALRICPCFLVNDVDDIQLSASSNYHNLTNLYTANYARLDTVDTVPGTGAWKHDNLDPDPYIQVDFLDVKMVEGVVTQGRNSNHNQWVTQYQVVLSIDCVNWEHVVDTDGAIVTFPGNTDRNSRVTNLFDSKRFARCVRVKPVARHQYPSMRFDVLGCDA